MSAWSVLVMLLHLQINIEIFRWYSLPIFLRLKFLNIPIKLRFNLWNVYEIANRQYQNQDWIKKNLFEDIETQRNPLEKEMREFEISLYFYFTKIGKESRYLPKWSYQKSFSRNLKVYYSYVRKYNQDASGAHELLTKLSATASFFFSGSIFLDLVVQAHVASNLTF